MNVQRLCPVYRKWLQLNPSNARQHRYAMQAQTQQAHQQGKLDYARELGYQTFEAAKVILNALQPTSSQKVSVVQEDVLAFSTMGMYLSTLLAEEHRKRESHAILQECQQQLIAILPLHATNPSVCRLITSIQHAVINIGMEACEAIRCEGAYDFGQSDLIARLHEKGMALTMEHNFWHTPPVDALFIHRKLGGLFLLAKRLKAKVDMRKAAGTWLNL